MLKFCLLAAVVLGLACVCTQAWAVFPDIESFDNDTDSYEPTAGVNPLNDPNLDGVPPEDWNDIRIDRAGVIEEVPDGFDGTNASHGGHFGVVALEGGVEGGVQGYPAAQVAPLEEAWSFRADIFTDSRINSTLGPGGGRSYLPDFWWTNGVNNITGAPGDERLDETGFDFEVFDRGGSEGKTWLISSTIGNYLSSGGGTEGGVDPFEAEVDTWYTFEVIFHESSVRPGQAAADLKIWNQAHTELLWTLTQNTLSTDPAWSLVGGPSYSWFVYPTPNLDYIYVDEVGVGPPIELVPGFVLGDMDGDGDLDNFDISPFELALTNRVAWESQYNLHDADDRGDIDGSGSLTNFDISPFEQLLTAGPGPAAVPEPTGWALGLAALAGLMFGQRRRVLAGRLDD